MYTGVEKSKRGSNNVITSPGVLTAKPDFLIKINSEPTHQREMVTMCRGRTGMCCCHQPDLGLINPIVRP